MRALIKHRIQPGRETQMVRHYLFSGAALLCAALPLGPAAGAEGANIPNFASTQFGWLLQGGIDFRPVPGTAAPIRFDAPDPLRGASNQRGIMQRISDAENSTRTD